MTVSRWIANPAGVCAVGIISVRVMSRWDGASVAHQTSSVLGSIQRAGHSRCTGSRTECRLHKGRSNDRLPEHLQGDGRVPGGLAELRKLVAGRYTESGLATNADQITITNGAMGALATMLDATRGPVLVEDPTYHGALEQTRYRRRRLIGWQRSGHWDLQTLTTLVSASRPTLIYAVPDFHNPSGHPSPTPSQQA